MTDALGVGYVTAELPPQIPHGSVVITPSQMYEEIRATHDEVKHVAAILDPSLAEIRSDVADNARRISSVDAAAHERDDRLDERLRTQESRAVVTPRSMWTGIGTIAAVVAVIATIAIALLR